MIEIERHIEILLLSNDCVIVPELGGFMAHPVEARYDEVDGMFLPPMRTLGFNPQLRLNDHLLVQSYIEAYDISYPEALRRIEKEVAELKQHLEAEGSYELNGIGILSLNDEGNILFEPCEAGILTPELYGLSTYEMIPLAEAKVKPITTAEANAETSDTSETTLDSDVAQEIGTGRVITIRMSWIRNAVAAAAAIIAFFMMGTPVSNSDSELTIEQSSMLPITVKDTPAATQPEQKAPVKLQESPAVQNEKVQEAVLAEPINYVIVLASQTTTHHAEDFINSLKNKGFDKTNILPMTRTNKVRVTYGSYHSEEEAHSQLRSLRAKDKVFAEAWVLNTSKR